MDGLRNVGIVTGAYLLAATFAAWMTGNAEFLFYIAVVVFLGAAAVTLHLRAGLSAGVLWALSLWGLLHMIGGLMPLPAEWPYAGTKAVFYSWWIIPQLLKYDQVVHAYGFGVATWLCWQAVRSAFRLQRPTFGVLLLCALGGMGLGAFNEVVEFVATLLIQDTNVGDYANTGWDLVANMAGATMAGLIIRYGRS